MNLNADVPLLEAGLEHGAGEAFQLPLEGAARGPDGEVEPQVQALGSLLLEGAHPELAALGGALPVDPAGRIPRPPGPRPFRAAGPLLGHGAVALAPPARGRGRRRAGMGQDEQLLVQVEEAGLLHQAEGEARAELQAPGPGPATMPGPGVEDHQGLAIPGGPAQEARFHLAVVGREVELQAPEPPPAAVLDAV